ncbi:MULTISPECIES: hypothetical protein [Rhodococcus]|jgi:hypothetical protein|uniref:Uncharacterized protein n=1 Tax=Rhodococcus pseudokoreensis TaxID=2811421 RepID=A0A974ZRD8_9NOCA|nr:MULTISPECIES: hypothetical protein [Rhodococcus]MDJ0420822.1 hypothetical protein [Rhodococcus opacus]MDV6245236.1 hypothetical protein [Rhodococcus opacus]QSE87381.1 hypothetical protein JWS13_01660 [Rhodococcus pseudokoreensis]QXC46736.1 hypothetical protein KSE96_32205 [Rhodococcus qingshengii]WKN60017.1 hypothetical protein HJ581_0040025 [Rhodococcus opacus]
MLDRIFTTLLTLAGVAADGRYISLVDNDIAGTADLDETPTGRLAQAGPQSTLSDR